MYNNNVLDQNLLSIRKDPQPTSAAHQQKATKMSIKVVVALRLIIVTTNLFSECAPHMKLGRINLAPHNNMGDE